MERKILIVLHLVGAALSVALLVSTFVAKGLITSKVRQVAVEKSRAVSDPLAAKLQETLDRPMLGKLIRGDARERMETELTDYLRSPDAWLVRLAEGGGNRAKVLDLPEIESPVARKAIDVLLKGVTDLKAHLAESYRALILDVRVFAATNLIAFLLAAGLAKLARTPRARHWLIGYSFIMLIAFAGSILLYLNQNWMWSLLRNDYMGWDYAALLGVITLCGILYITPELVALRPSASNKSRLP